jgi:kynurenine formamidase
VQPLHERIAGAEVIDLSHVMRAGMPQYPTQTPFQLLLARRHGDNVRADGSSAASEVLVFGGHSGTHVDALGHFSSGGMLYGGHEALAHQGPDGLKRGGVDELGPQLRRGVLLDVAGLHGVDHLPAGYEVTADDVAGAQDAAGTRIRPGDAVLVRTGWSAHWDDPQAYLGQQDGTPGPGADAAQLLIDAGAALVGSDTLAFEVRGPGREALVVHRMLLAEAGIPIIECLDLAELARRGPTEFTLLLLPLRLAGATASPVRPVALLER